MSTLKDILIPAAVAGMVLAGNLVGEAPVHRSFDIEFEAADTVLYQVDAYKLNRN